MDFSSPYALTPSEGPGRIVVLCDSRSYYGPRGGLPANDPRIWPNIVARHFHYDLTLSGKIGWTSRDAYWSLIQDPNLWASLPNARSVIIAVGGMDSLPSPLPTVWRESIRYIRPDRLRRVIRNAYFLVQPQLSRLQWPQALPAHTTVSYLDKIRTSILHFRPNLPMILFTPGRHRAPAYHQVHSGYAKTLAAMTQWAVDNDVTVVDVCSTIESFFERAGDLSAYGPEDINDDLLVNLDGIHWGFELHEQIAQLAIDALQQQLTDFR